jgi:isocitrate dehydrogenase
MPISRRISSRWPYEKKIMDEIAASEGTPVDLGGYYHPDPAKRAAAMRPSKTLNSLIG